MLVPDIIDPEELYVKIIALLECAILAHSGPSLHIHSTNHAILCFYKVLLFYCKRSQEYRMQTTGIRRETSFFWRLLMIFIINMKKDTLFFNRYTVAIYKKQGIWKAEDCLDFLELKSRDRLVVNAVDLRQIHPPNAVLLFCHFIDSVVLWLWTQPETSRVNCLPSFVNSREAEVQSWSENVYLQKRAH